jgi:hypothetical protein
MAERAEQTTDILKLPATVSFGDQELAELNAIIDKNKLAVEKAELIIPLLREFGALWHWGIEGEEAKVYADEMEKEVNGSLLYGGIIYDLRESDYPTVDCTVIGDHSVFEGLETPELTQVDAINLESRHVLLGAYAVEHQVSGGYLVMSNIAFIANTQENIQTVEVSLVPSESRIWLSDELLPTLAAHQQ